MTLCLIDFHYNWLEAEKLDYLIIDWPPTHTHIYDDSLLFDR